MLSHSFMRSRNHAGCSNPLLNYTRDSASLSLSCERMNRMIPLLVSHQLFSFCFSMYRPICFWLKHVAAAISIITPVRQIYEYSNSICCFKILAIISKNKKKEKRKTYRINTLHSRTLQPWSYLREYRRIHSVRSHWEKRCKNTERSRCAQRKEAALIGLASKEFFCIWNYNSWH